MEQFPQIQKEDTPEKLGFERDKKTGCWVKKTPEGGKIILSEEEMKEKLAGIARLKRQLALKREGMIKELEQWMEEEAERRKGKTDK